MKHIGLVGERMILDVTVDEVEPVVTDFGEIAKHHMHTADGNRLLWNASADTIRLNPGQTYKVRVTVKAHEVDKAGEPFTSIFRVMPHVGKKIEQRIQKRAVGLGRGAARVQTRRPGR